MVSVPGRHTSGRVTVVTRGVVAPAGVTPVGGAGGIAGRVGTVVGSGVGETSPVIG
jgi:hypothetical protein